MALPVSPAPRSDDIAVLGWSAITVRIAWTMILEGIKIKPDLLADARRHALLHIEPHRTLHDAEDMAAALTVGFLNRARGRACADPWPQDMHLSVSRRWKRAIERTLTRHAEVVFRKHYGDNRKLDALAAQLQVDRLALEAARAGLREVVREAAMRDDVPIGGWPVERIDRLLVRLAAYSPGPCPPLPDVIVGGFREHVIGCPRCDRTARLVRANYLTVADLMPPTLGARPRDRIRLLALHFHPDGRRHLRTVRQELDAQTFKVGEDLLLVDAKDADPVFALLRTAAEVATPHRDHLRGVLLDGHGAWSDHGVVGPLTERALTEVRQRPWGTLEGLGELPEPLPEPPSARPIWFMVTLLAAIGVYLLWMAVAPGLPAGAVPLEVAFSEGRGGVWVAFDTAEEALVSLVGLEGEALMIHHPGRAAPDKVPFAVGDGTYRVHVPGDGVLVVSSLAPLELERLVQEAGAGPDPLHQLGLAIQRVDPDAAWRVHRR